MKHASPPKSVQVAEPSPQSGELPILYVKTGCPWCNEVINFLSEHGIGYREKNVSQDPAALQELQQKTKQSKALSLDWHGKILADFGVVELKPFLRDRNVKFEDS